MDPGQAMSCVTLTNDQLIDQIEAALMKYGHADVTGSRARAVHLKKGINRLVAEALARGISVPWIRML